MLVPGLRGPQLVPHPTLWFAHAPNLDLTCRFSELPTGRFEYRTNGHGFRNDAEVSPGRPDLRVLVTGDSHVAGACDNAQTFPNVLADLLQRRLRRRAIESLNAAVGFYNLYNYLNVIEEYAASLRPDVFVTTVFGGNDFSGTAVFRRDFHREPMYRSGPVTPTGFLELTRRGRREVGVLAQDLLQAIYFANNPEDEAPVTATVLAITDAIVACCEANGVRPLWVYLPPASSGQPQLVREAYDAALAAVGLARDALAVSDRIADAWLRGLRARGLQALDLRPILRDQKEPCYWTTDLHLNVHGHAVVARALMREILSPPATRQ